MTTPDPTANPLETESLDGLLERVLQENRDKVVGWIKGEPGCWGFLAGKAVTVCRSELGRSLADQERRLVWHRLWLLLGGIKARVG